MEARWTDDELRDFVAGSVLSLRSAAAVDLAAPPWLAAAAAGVDASGWSNGIADIDAHDRADVVRGWWQSLRRPRTVVEVPFWERIDSGPIFRCARFLNLIDDERVGGVLLSVVDADPSSADLQDRAGAPAIRTSEDVLSPDVSAPAWVVQYVDEIGTIRLTEGMVEELYQRPREELVGRSGMEFLHPDGHAAVVASWLEIVDDPGAARTIQQRILRPDGSSVWVESTVMNRLHDDAINAVMIVCHDITERHEQEVALHASRQELRMLAEDVPAAVFRVDTDGQLTFGNARFVELVGFDPIDHLHDAFHPADRPIVDERLEELISPSGPDTMSFELRAASGGRLFSCTARAVGTHGTARRTVIGAMHDVTSTAELRHHARHDDLTGTLNRRALDQQIEEAFLAAEPELPQLLVVFLDLDGFKEVNDRNGHDIGDLVLHAVGQRLRRVIRPDDDIGRYGGDEFVIVCRDAPLGAEAVLEQCIAKAFAEPVTWHGGSWRPHASVGLARPQPGDTAASIIPRADRAMYRQKHRRPAADTD